MVSFSDRPAFLAACDHARTIALSAYVLPQSVAERLARDARHGARVSVTLVARPLGGTFEEQDELAARNLRAIRTIERAGGRGRLLPHRIPLHMKAAVLDGSVAFLDDRNWSDDGSQTILRDDDPADVAAVARALALHAASTSRLATVKPESLALETALIGNARAPLSVESESFGRGVVYDALEAAAKRGVSTRLLVAQREVDAAAAKNGRELKALGTLAHDGIDVRVTPSDEKMAIAGDAAWVGSTNATSAAGFFARQLDWGMTTQDAAIVAGLRDRFEQTWKAAVPWPRYAAASAPNAARAFTSVRAETSSTLTPSTSATARALSTTYAGSFRLPRNGTGARYGQSVSSTMRSIPTARTASRSAPAVLNVTTPPIPSHKPNSEVNSRA